MAIALVIAFAGCGGGGGSSSDSAAAGGETTSTANGGLNKSDSPKAGGESSGGGEAAAGKSAPSSEISDSGFVEQANTICEESKKQGLEKVSVYVKAHRSSGQTNFETLKEAIQAVIVPAIQTQAEEIRALSVSGEDEAKVDAFATALEEGVESAEEAKDSAHVPFAHSFQHSSELAHEYGLDGCAYA